MIEEKKSTLNAEKVQASVKALKSLIKSKSKKKSLFNEDNHQILLQITCVKVPDVKCTGILRPKLPNSLVTKSSDVCLITADLRKGVKIDHEPTVRYYNQVLNRHNCDSLIKQIVPFRQIRAEYSTYEMKRKFSNMYDFYLADGRISERLVKQLGKPFFKNRKFPIPVKFDDNVGENIKTALHRSHLLVDGKGQTSIMQVGHSGMKIAQIAENVVAVADFLAEKYPGGWSNVRSLHIKTPNSKAVPVFYRLISPNDVTRPVWEKSQPKAAVPVSDFVNTCMKKVTVMPDGNVIVGEAEVSDEEEAPQPVVEPSEATEKSAKGTEELPKKAKKRKVEIEDAEAEYLSQWKQKFDRKMEKIEEKIEKRERKKANKKLKKQDSKAKEMKKTTKKNVKKSK
nr:PREDICTED: ribosomal L1 domain-containing protein 1-like [Bemisia tabaci]